MSNNQEFDLAVIGGGAAGFFGAVNAAALNARLRIVILEKSPKLLSKVKISGGGRCNVTHHCFEATPLSQHYPRGQKQLKKLFRSFQATDTVAWFADRGVQLKTEEDGRMFPTSDDSQSIINCFLKEAQKFNIEIMMNEGVETINLSDRHFEIQTRTKTIIAQNVLVAIGGHPQTTAYEFIRKLGHTVTPLIPSLFTFNDANRHFAELMGVAVNNATVKIAGTDLSELGPVLITHWGLSGPAVIKLSAWAAEYLHSKQYTFTALVNWLGEQTEEDTRQFLHHCKISRGKQKIITNPLFGLPTRLWTKLITECEIYENKIWAEASNKEINRLVEQLIRCPFHIRGKTTFKEEFVTCGGVDLAEIELDTMQSKKVKGLYFAGEVLNIDGETGGFNFQAAWTTSFIAAKAIAPDFRKKEVLAI
ncbi:MAG: NAD(P)/FAD-dependent oxidoreductase [Flammeovirgaceae bacterium]